MPKPRNSKLTPQQAMLIALGKNPDGSDSGIEAFDKPNSHEVTMRWLCAMRAIVTTLPEAKNRKMFALSFGQQSQNKNNDGNVRWKLKL